MSYQYFFQILKSNAQKTAQKIKKCIKSMCLRFQFCTHKMVCILHFLKKSQIRCTLGCARFAKKNFSLISEIKRIWIRFTCVSLFHYKISLLFFCFFSLIFASNFSLRFAKVIFALKLNKVKQNSSLLFCFFCFFSLFFVYFVFSLFFAFFRLFLL